MCYSTTLRKQREEIERNTRRQFAIPLEYTPYYRANGFAHPNLYIVKMDEPDMIYPAMWGLIPDFGKKDIQAFQKKYNTLNAKSETVLTSNTYKNSAENYRCLILADGFHEPHRFNNASYPYFCHYDDDSLFCFAGLYTELDDDFFSCSILTMPANEQFSKIHNQKKRQPLILDESFETDWLRPDLTSNGITELMKVGFTTKEIEAYPVTRDIYKRGFDADNLQSITKIDYPELNIQ
ncbi:SOS response-associated peptidase [Zobellia galactanivorans]|uniref:Abasic site processing protein n=1 Tax=Zobellia galactanivorans (strain DSM 12802 / CCUG 47099 / CIP 106680 / NCIMB 13871 / Dsij) TaxID=63186 RepID=G0L491_ZOBGA|nr:SOS response-associated peptidase [Zobellia galactanivorans]CAZ98733.1 Conserved hypothetical protein [Zobellia galactanivorans]